jgi:hypothetical protein
LIRHIRDDLRRSEHRNPRYFRLRKVELLQIDFPEIVILVCFEVEAPVCEISVADPLRGFPPNRLVRHRVGHQAEGNIKGVNDVLGQIEGPYSVRLNIGESG